MAGGTSDVSVAVVGGGIAGGALAARLSLAGCSVLVLERSEVFVDRVRGELLHAWGVAEAKKLGVEQALIQAGGRYTSTWRRYSRWSTDTSVLPMSKMVPDVAGSMNVGHPSACQALLDTAEMAGAEIYRGVEQVGVVAGSRPTVRWRDSTGEHDRRVDLVVGADGRGSTVRRQCGIELERQRGTTCISGLLLEGIEEVPSNDDVTVSDEDLYLLMFRQTESRARAYLCTGLEDRSRFAGRAGAEEFLAACGSLPYPWADALRNAVVAGPCSGTIGDDSWAPLPFVDGVVLIGDAAGFNDPIMGQGLSVALRDARMVAEVILDGGKAEGAFVDYGRERLERMRRLRLLADIIAIVQAEDCGNRLARHERLTELMETPGSGLPAMLQGIFAGPETIPPEAIDDRIPDQLRSAD